MASVGALIPKRTSIAIAICTFNRNDLLTRLLDALLVCAERLIERAAVGVVLVDDSPEGLARPVAEAFAQRFELGLQFMVSGRQNISLARNLAMETAMVTAAWTAMTDDDCEPPPEWLEALLDVQLRTKADAITGRMIRRVPTGSPRWIYEQPFLQLGVEEATDCGEVSTAATFNTMISNHWLKLHPELRFSQRFGVSGGEDVVFFRSARAAGLRICYSESGFVFENEPPERANFVYQLYVYLWHGNSATLACIEGGSKPWRMMVHSCASLTRAALRPLLRLIRGQKPQFRFCLAQVLQAFGKLIGVLGVRIQHR